jgi:hypothetical protein
MALAKLNSLILAKAIIFCIHVLSVKIDGNLLLFYARIQRFFFAFLRQIIKVNPLIINGLY